MHIYKATKSLTAISLRAIYILMILSMLLSAVGIDSVSAAPKDTALQFNGSTQYVTFGSSAGTATGLGAQVFTIETWFKKTGNGATTTTGTGGLTAIPLISKGRGDGDNSNLDTNYFLGIDASGVLAADFEECSPAAQTPICLAGGTAGLNHPVRATTVISNNVWYHAAVTYDGRYWKVYLNGVLETVTGGDVGATRYPRWDSIEHAGIGTAMTSAGLAAGFFQGIIDEPRIWNVVRTQAEIAGSMNSDLTGGTGLIGRWGLNEGTGITAANSIAGRPNITSNLMPNATPPAWYSPDLTPPSAPTALASTPYSGSVSLSWTAPADLDLAGYNVYRSTSPSVPLTSPINGGTLVSSTTYSDGGRTNGTPYYYVVTAVDTSANQSIASNEVNATPLASLGAGLNFDGTNDYVTFGNVTGLGLQTFTIETWFKKTGTGATSSTGNGGITAIPLVTKGRGEAENTTQDMNYFFGIDSTGVLAADFEECARAQSGCPATTSNATTGGQNYPVKGTTVIQNNIWYHAAVTFDGRYWKLYLNGILETMTAGADTGASRYPRWDSIQHAGLGTAMNSTGVNEGFFAGVIDEARIWNVVRTQPQIMGSINSEVTSGTGLVARWGINEGTGTSTASSVGTFPGTLTNGPVWVAGSPFNVAPPSVPAAPTLLATTPTAGLQVDLSWTDNSNNETSFKVERSLDGSTGWAQIGTTATNVATYSNGGLDPATQYCYRVRASNSVGDSAYSNTSCATTPGEPNNGLYFGASNAYVDLDNPSALGLQTFTIETWFKRTEAGATSYTGSGGVVAVPLVSKGMAETETIATDVNYFLGIGNIVGNSTNVLVADFEECTLLQVGCPTGGTSGLNHPVVGVTPIAADGVWHHAAVTYDGQIWKLYLDGNLETTLNLGAVRYPQFASTQKTALGSALNSTGLPGTSGTYGPGYFVGNLDETRVWNKARTQAEIRGTMNSPITSSQSGLVARWGLNETTGAAVSSSAGTSAPGTISGTGYSWGAGASAVVNHTPAFISGTPVDLAIGVSTSPTLSVNVSDVDLDNLTVKFYGRAKSTDFALIAIPDTQNYSATYPAIFADQTNWIVNNQASRNIAFVTHLGDTVNVGSDANQWINAVAAMNILDASGIPYGMAVGNHDQNPYQTSGATAEFNANFGVSRFEGRAYYGGHYGAKNDNSYQLFRAGGMDFIVIHLEYNDSMDSAVTAWADNLLHTYNARRAIVITHNLLNSNTPTTQATAIWNGIKDNANLFLMMGGHLDTAGQTSLTGTNGNTVDLLRSDYQNSNSQQSGYLRILNFKPQTNEIFVETYSPHLPGSLTDTANQFTLDYPMSGSAFQQIGTDQIVTSGNGAASVNWAGLNPAKEYEWYAEISDTIKTTTPATRSFTTEAAGNQAPIITEGASTSVTMSEDSAPTAFSKTLNATDAEGNTLTWSISTPASNGAASASGTGASKAIAYTPTANYNGVDSFVVTVSDGNGGSDTITVNVTVQPVNDVAVCTDVALTTPEDTAGEATPSCTDVDTDDTLTYSIVAQPSHGSASVVAGKLNYVPAANYSGADSFTYKANDSHVDSNTSTVTVTVTPANDAPVVTNPGTQTNTEGNAVSLQIAATDADIPAQTLTYSAAILPDGLSINPATGLISGTISYHAAAHSPFSASVTVTDGTVPTAQNFTWNVTQAASGLCGSDSNMVGCWQMEESSGAVLIDATAFGNDGDITGSPTWVAGKTGQALSLSGTGQYAVVTNSSLDIGTNNITLSAWVKPGKLGTQNIIKKTTGTTSPGYELSLSNAGKVFVRFNGNVNYRVDSATSYPVDGTTWMHIAATYDGTTIKLYVNGIGENPKAVSFTIAASTTNLGIGAEPVTAINLFQGTIDDARVYNRALTLAEIQSLAGVTPPACYSLTLNHIGQGSDPVASPANSTGCAAGQYTAGASINLSGAVPTTGWQISSWTGTTNNVSSANTNTVTMPAGNHTAGVNYAQSDYTLTIVSANGTVTANPEQATYHENDVVVLTAAPSVDWTFANWTGALTGSSNPGSVTIHGNTTVTANYTQNEYTISGNAGVAGATISYTGGSTTANGSGGYSFTVLSGWSGTVTPSMTGYTFIPPSRTYTNITTNQTIQDYSATPVAPSPSGLTCTNLTPKPATASTGEKPQSKVWTYDGNWYAVFPTNATGASSAGTWLWKLQGTVWTEVVKLSDRTDTKADVKAAGALAHILLYADSNTQYSTVEYVAGNYQLWSTRPTLASISLPGSEIATIDVDSTGKLWLASRTSTGEVIVYHSDSPYSTWNGPIVLATGVVGSDDLEVVTAMPNNKIGVLWSNQNTKRFGFRTHADGDNPSTWSADELPASQSAQNVGAGMADDHMNLAVASDGTLYAAVKTSYDTAGYAKMALLIRRPNGTWDNLYSIDEAGTRPIILLDEAQGILTYIYTSVEGYNPIVYKQSSTQSISFSSRTTLRNASFNDVSSMKANYTDEFVVIYSSASEVGGQICAPTPVSGADLSITKTDGLVTVRPNDTVTYTIVASNSGPEAITGATVADTFPSALTNISWTCSAAGGASCASSGAGNISASVNLPVGGSVTFTVSAKVDLGARDSITNIATVTAPVGTSDPILSNNSATDSDSIVIGGTSCESDATLVGCWQMEENGGSVLIDGSSYLNDGALNGAPAWGVGKVGIYALDLNGTTQYAVVADDATLDLTNQITLSAWIKPEQYGTQDVIKKATNGVTNGYELSLATTKADASSQRAFFRINQIASGDTYRINATTEYPINGTWMHVAATFDGTTMRLYINGVLENSLTTPAGTLIATNNLPLTIGAQDGSTSSRWFMGWVDETRVYNRALSSTDIMRLAGITPTYALTVSKTGSGSVTSIPSGIDCGATCSYNFDENTSVALTATADAGYTFTGWSGACTGTGACNVTMSTAKSVNATFTITNISPVAVTDTYNTNKDVTLTVTAPGVLTNDTDSNNDSLTAVKVSDPAHGTLTLNANGSFTYIPSSGYVGDDSYTYKANDGIADSNTATVTIHVNSTTPPPPLPSGFYGEIHIFDNPPQAGDTVQVFAPGISGPVASAVISNALNLVYSIDVPGDIVGTLAKEGGVEGETLTFKINDRVVASSIWHSGTNINLNLHPPVALPGGPYTGAAGTAINFAASVNDWGAGVATYQWDWDNNGTYDQTGQSLSHTWANYGTYTVGLKVTDSQGGEGIATVSVTVNKAPATVTLSNLPQTYNGTSRPITVVTDPAGLSFSITYNGASIAPTNAGSYAVVATITDLNHTGFASGTLIIAPASATVILSNLNHVYDGTAKSAVAVTAPAGLTVNITYAGSGSAPSAVGNYAVLATITDPNYSGSASGVLVISAYHSIALVSGWNLVSFNLHPTNTAIANVLSSIAGNYDLVYAWDATGSHSGSGNWLKYDPSMGFGNTLLNLDETMGFWIHMTSADTLQVVGSQPVTMNIQLLDNAGGWNLVGYPSASNIDLPAALNAHGVSNAFSLIYSYYANNIADPWNLFDRLGPAFANDLTQMIPGWGYWIKVNADLTWDVEYLAP